MGSVEGTLVRLPKQAIVVEFNEVLATIVAGHQNGAFVDEYTSFFCHGHNYNQATCPKYTAGAVGWMADLIHPNAAGHANLGNEMRTTINSIYACK